MTALLEVEGLHVGYGRTIVVRDVGLTVNAGEVVALLGPNGAGKTTTLMAIAGLLAPAEGTVRFKGALSDKRAHKLAHSGLAFVPDDRGLFPSLTVAEHLRVSAGRRSRHQAMEQVLSWFPALSGLLDRPVGKLSGGEQQMLALALAFETSPELLLIDELSLGLAPLVVQSLIPILQQVITATNCGVLLVEQHANVALELASRAVVMAHGEVKMSLPTAALRADPELLRTAYLG